MCAPFNRISALRKEMIPLPINLPVLVFAKDFELAIDFPMWVFTKTLADGETDFSQRGTEEFPRPIDASMRKLLMNLMLRILRVLDLDVHR